MTYSAKADWRVLFGAARATTRDNWHRDVAAVYAAAIAADNGCRAGFALRHASAAAEIARLDHGGRMTRGAWAARHWRARRRARHAAIHPEPDFPSA